MSVPKWQRSQSATEYLWQIYKLNIDVAEIVSNKPKKYKSTHSDLLIKYALMALSSANMANDIYVKTAEDLKRRVDLLKRSMSYIYNVALMGDIFLELCKKSPDCDKKKMVRQQERIGTACAECLKLLTGVIKSDKKRYKF